MSLAKLSNREIELIVTWFKIEDRCLVLEESISKSAWRWLVRESENLIVKLSSETRLLDGVSDDDRMRAVGQCLKAWHQDTITRLCLEQELKRRSERNLTAA